MPIIVYNLTHLIPTFSMLKQTHIASEHSTHCGLTENISKEPEQSNKQPATPVDRRANNKNLFWYSACVRMAMMPELVSTVSWKTVVRNNRKLPLTTAIENKYMIVADKS